MFRFYAPAAVALLAIVGLTAVEASFSDRFNSSGVSAEEFGKRFANVPKVVGQWVGQDMKEEAATLEMAGAVRHVSRRYTNSETGKSVDLWLIVGHSRDVCRHTPDICYPSHGMAQKGVKVKQSILPPEDEENPAVFFTSKFRDERGLGGPLQRVFWAWNGNKEGQYKWDAPEPKSFWSWMPIKSSGPKAYYGNNPALYKVYFTAAMESLDEPVGDNVAVEFAEVMLPKINHALFPERYPNAGDDAAADASAATTEEAAAASDVTAADSDTEPVVAAPAAETEAAH
jgi:hypothetical protein